MRRVNSFYTDPIPIGNNNDGIIKLSQRMNENMTIETYKRIIAASLKIPASAIITSTRPYPDCICEKYPPLTLSQCDLLYSLAMPNLQIGSYEVGRYIRS